MKILLTGCEGQVGSSVMKQIPEVIACNKTMLNIAELSSVKENIEKYGPEVVINCAAYTAVDKAESDEKTAFAVNAKGPENLAKICGDKNIVLLHLSTDYVFDGQKKTPYLETDMPNPTSVYGHSKWEGEKAIREFCARYIILRVSWVFGEQGNNFVKTMLRLSKTHDTLKVVSDQKGCPTYAGDIAEVLLKLAHHPVSGTYHYCNTPATNWFEFAKAIIPSKEIHPIDTVDYPTPAQRPKNSVLDCHLFEKTFNLSCKPWKIGLEKVRHAVT